ITANYGGDTTHGTSSGTTTVTVTQPTIAISDVSANEGNAGPTPFVFTVTLSNASSQTVTVQYATADGTATVADTDYIAASGTVTFLPGQTSQHVTGIGNGDTKFEPKEAFFVNLTLPTNATISDGQGQGTIVNAAIQPTFVISDVSPYLPTPRPSDFVFTVTLSNASSQTVTVQYATADGTATVADTDYIAASGTVTFLPGQTSQPVTVTVNGDTKSEADETFFVQLTGPTNATIRHGQGQGTIVNDDTQPTIAISDVTPNEGTSVPTPRLPPGPPPFPYTPLFRSQYATADGTATVADTDYIAASGTVTFLPGQTSQPVTVIVNGDTKFEPNETFFVNLTLPTNATISDGQGQGTIVNDDTKPTLSINNVTQAEGDVANNSMRSKEHTSELQSRAHIVRHPTPEKTTTVADTAYITASRTLKFMHVLLNDTATANIYTLSLHDALPIFFVNLTLPTNATISDGQGQGTIVNDDAKPTLSINNVTQAEGDVANNFM